MPHELGDLTPDDPGNTVTPPQGPRAERRERQRHHKGPVDPEAARHAPRLGRRGRGGREVEEAGAEDGLFSLRRGLVITVPPLRQVNRLKSPYGFVCARWSKTLQI
jgi:hypothetical protein